MKMETISSSETSVISKAIRRLIPEDNINVLMNFGFGLFFFSFFVM
jgi:hypothetical protein